MKTSNSWLLGNTSRSFKDADGLTLGSSAGTCWLPIVAYVVRAKSRNCKKNSKKRRGQINLITICTKQAKNQKRKKTKGNVLLDASRLII
jgi:hypothetical protein